MDYEVVVVGGGIGGLTTAALLAARGVSVCLCERQAHPGGCIANVEHSGFAFEPTGGLYAGWESGGLYERIFAQLPVAPPAVHRLSPAYVVRLPDRTEVTVSESAGQFEEHIRRAFPECSEEAVAFYQQLEQINTTVRDGSMEGRPVEVFLSECSPRFQRFIDVQLQTFTQGASDQCCVHLAAEALTNPRRGLWSIRGGAQALANALADSLKQSGASLRLNAPVLRLSYGSDDLPVGVDLLSGERVTATRAIVSNLTVWDTYGKLIGLSRTPASISRQLRQMKSWGAYLLFLSMDRSAVKRLTSNRILALTDWQEDQSYSPEQTQFLFSVAPESDARAPEDKLAVTVSTFTNVDDWFTFHEDEAAHEEQDQSALESLWARLHTAMPELGNSVEVIETATPRAFYEDTRRKLGMIGRPVGTRMMESLGIEQGQTVFPNVFLVSDTNAPGLGLAGVSQSALDLADFITNR